MPEHTIPESLIEQIRTGRAVLVVGAGVGVSTWKQLLEKLNDALESRGDEGDDIATKDVAKLLHKGSLARAAGFLARRLGEEACDATVEETWQTPEELPEVARAIARLPFREVWTTFPGDILEKAMAQELPDEWPLPQVLTYKNIDDVKVRRRSLVKILGDFGSYVVTPKSVRAALSKATAFREHARDFYSDGALLFVGFRFGDPDLAALLDRVFGAYDVPQSDHYLIASGVGPVTVDELKYEHHIQVINLSGKGADEKATGAFLEYLAELSGACDAAGISLSQSSPDADDLDGWLALLAADPDAEAPQEALEAIEASARESGDADTLIHLLMGVIEIEESPSNRAALLRQLAEVYETMVGDLPAAFTALTAALRVDPADTTAVDEAERLADDTDGWAELVADVSEVAGEIDEPAVAAGYWARLGRWYHGKLKHYDYAIASYREAMRLDGGNLDVYVGLEELYRRQQRWAELSDLLREHVDLEGDIDKKIDLHLALGDLFETQLASTSRAIDAYQAAVDLDESNDDALACLERLYRRDERWGKLANVLEQRADVIEDGGDASRASALRRELATLRADKLGDLEGAIGRYEAAVETDESDVVALRSLEELYEKVGRTGDYLRTLERLAEVLPEADRASTLRRLAAELEEREGGRAQAIACLQQVLDLEPSADDAYRALERVLRSEAEWYDLVATYERHIAALKAPGPRVELYLTQADVYESQLDDPHRAIEGYLNALDINSEHQESMLALARLYRRTEAWDRAVDLSVRHAELEGPRGAHLWFQAGQVSAEKLDDAESAVHYLDKALALDPEHLGAMRALARVHTAQASWSSAIRMLAEAEKHSQSRQERIEMLLEAASIASEKLESPETALELLLRVLEHDPDNEEAGIRAAERLTELERWDEVVPILEMLARKADGSDRLEKARREAAVGRAYEQLQVFERAAKHFRGALEADPDSLEAALGLASMLFSDAQRGADTDTDKWTDVDRRYREILARHRTGLADSQVVEIWFRLGVTTRVLGDDKKAHNAFRRALERDPGHGPSLAAIIEVGEARDDWKTVVEAKRDQLDNADEATRLTLHEQIGDIYKDRLADPVSALGSYLEAIKMRPNSHVLLHKTLEIYSSQKQWRRAIETLDTLAEDEADIVRRSKYRYAAAVIARDELKDVDVAVDHFHMSLDDVPTTPKAFEAIDRLLTEKGDWKNLARAYRKMLKRVGEGAPSSQLLRLWTRLGDVCIDHLGDTEAAIAAFEVASSLDPTDMDRHEQLADLYLEAGESRRHDAIEELQVLIQHSPDRVELYRALSALYQDEAELDKSYCLAQALVFLGSATDEERALFDGRKPKQFVLAKRRLTEELWQKAIIHRRENRHVNAVFSQVIGSVAATTAQPASAFNLSPKSRTDVDKDGALISRIFKYASNLMALDPEPHLYMQNGADVGIRVANTRDGEKLVPSVLIGDPHANKTDDRELAFELGKRLAYFRPERYVNYALQTLPKLENAYTAALCAAGVEQEEGGEDVEKLTRHLKKTVPGAVLDQVGALARKLGGKQRNGLIAGWRTATDLTANRIGLILCNDLETAARVIATEQTSISTLPAKDRLRDLLAYAVSEEYFAVRRHLGIDARDGDS